MASISNYRHSDFVSQNVFGYGIALCESVVHKPSRIRMCRKEVPAPDSNEPLSIPLQRELHALSSLCHPYIVSYLGHYRHEDKLYILTELCGDTLSSLLEMHPKGLDPALVDKFLAQLVSAVLYLHQHNFIHRDIKPDNVVIDSDSNLKLIDFGTSRISAESMTAMQGTHGFLAPEVICLKQSYTASVDFFAIGIILYQMVTGRQLFNNNSYNTLRMEPDLTMINNVNFKKLLKCMLDKNYKSCLHDDHQKTEFVDRRGPATIEQFQQTWFQNLLLKHCEVQNDAVPVLSVTEFKKFPTMTFQAAVVEHRKYGTTFVKKLDGNDLSSLSITDRRSLEILTNLKHDNLVPFYGYFLHNGAIYVVTKYCEYDLRQYCYHSVGINPFEIIIPLLNCIRYLHRCGVILRNLSPEKIRVSADGIVYLVSFSGARTQVSANNFSLTQSAPVSDGLSMFCAPELHNLSLPYFFEVDFYSLGAVIYDLFINKSNQGVVCLRTVQLLCPDLNLRILVACLLHSEPLTRRQAVVELLKTALFSFLLKVFA
ncbi:hypothetical protein RCL1_002564 [Eukaryota sp. TZLM3-RCL]